MRNASRGQKFTEAKECSLVRHLEHEGVRPFGKLARRRAASGVNDLGGEEAERQVATGNDVVGENVRPGVIAAYLDPETRNVRGQDRAAPWGERRARRLDVACEERSPGKGSPQGGFLVLAA
jgi:hypothetical protein